MFNELLTDFWNALSVALTAPLYVGTLLHWPFLFSAAIVTVVLYLRRRGLRSFCRGHLTREIWWHPSARADYLLYLVNASLVPLAIAPFLTVSPFVAKLIRDVMGTPPGPPQEATWLVVIGYSVVIFICYDFGRYVGHWIQHKVPALWQFHRVHHSAEVLTPITSFRVHPVDLVLMAVIPSFFSGLVIGAGQSLGGQTFSPVTILGMHAGTAAYHMTSHLRHSSVWLSWGPMLSRVFVSPAQHQIHHSIEARHLNRNLGWALAIWDSLFGTLYVPKEEEKFTLGLGDGTEPEYRNVGKMYVRPFFDLWQLVKGQKAP